MYLILMTYCISNNDKVINIIINSLILQLQYIAGNVSSSTIFCLKFHAIYRLIYRLSMFFTVVKLNYIVNITATLPHCMVMSLLMAISILCCIHTLSIK